MIKLSTVKVSERHFKHSEGNGREKEYERVSFVPYVLFVNVWLLPLAGGLICLRTF